MSIRTILKRSVSAVAGAAMVAAYWVPASAMTLSAPSPAPHFAATQVEKVWWCRWGCGGWGWRGGWGYRGPGWGWGPAAVAGGVVAGAAVGAAVAARPYPYPCWRQVYGPDGAWRWERVC